MHPPMRGFLVFLIFLPLLIFGGTLAWVAQGESKLQRALNRPLPGPGPRPETEDSQVLKGWEVFNAKGCVFCHGPNGAGGVRHPNAVGGLIPGLTSVAEGYSDEELKNRILNGVRDISKENPDGPTPPLYMPAWKGRVTDEELKALAAFLKSLLPKGAKTEEW